MKRFYKTTYLVTVLSEDKPAMGLNLEEISEAITIGDCSGAVVEHDSEELSASEMAAALQEQGSDPEFLGINMDEGGVGVDGVTYLKTEFTRANFRDWLCSFQLSDIVGTSGDCQDNPLHRFATEMKFNVDLRIDPALLESDADTGTLEAVYYDASGMEAGQIALGQDWFKLAKRLYNSPWCDVTGPGPIITAEDVRRVLRNLFPDDLSVGVEVENE